MQAERLVDLVVLGGQEDHGQLALLAQLAEQFHPVHARHLDVEHREIGRAGDDLAQRLGRIGEAAYRIALGLEGHRDRGEDVAVVVDQGDRLGHGLTPLRFCGALSRAGMWRASGAATAAAGL